MPRDLPIGNGSLLINFDQNYHIRDIYYPHVGEFNHTQGHHTRIGIWTNGYFSWINWKKTLVYISGTLTTQVTAANSQLGIEVIINDAVDCHENIYLRKITVKNLSCHSPEIRLFISHNLHLLESRAGDTAYYDPGLRSIIHYKKNQYFLINVLNRGIAGIEHFAVGIQDFHGAEGTWRDAEDGTLCGDSIADGSVDSTLGMHLNIPVGDESVSYYWMAVGKDYNEVASLNKLVIDKTPQYFIDRTSAYWKSWAEKGMKAAYAEGALPLQKDSEEISAPKYHNLPDDLVDLYKRSLLILRTQIDNGGAITAANDFDPVETGMDGYSYVWTRDGAMIAYALDEAGYPEIS